MAHKWNGFLAMHSVCCPIVMMSDGQIKLFQFVRNCCKTMGCIHPRSINLRNSFIFVPVLLMFLSTTGYIIFEASLISEYAAASYVSTTELAIMVNFSVICFKMDDILGLIEMFEKIVRESKFQIILI